MEAKLKSFQDTRTLPASVIVDAVPQRNRYGKVVYWARLRPHDTNEAERRNRLAWESTGEPVARIGEVDLRRRVPEKEVRSLSLS